MEIVKGEISELEESPEEFSQNTDLRDKESSNREIRRHGGENA
jgi:hypothetical protein